MKKSSTNRINCSLNSSNLGQDITQCVKLEILLTPPQQGQQDGQVSNIVLLLIYWFTSNLNPHLIRPIQRNPIEICEYSRVKWWMYFINPNLNFL